MEDISFNTPEITKKDKNDLEEIIEEIYLYLYNLLKKDINKYLKNNNIDE